MSRRIGPGTTLGLCVGKQLHKERPNQADPCAISVPLYPLSSGVAWKWLGTRLSSNAGHRMMLIEIDDILYIRTFWHSRFWLHSYIPLGTGPSWHWTSHCVLGLMGVSFRSSNEDFSLSSLNSIYFPLHPQPHPCSATFETTTPRVVGEESDCG
jgi:hypothetical protein